MRSLIKLALLLVVGILVYNSFFGDEAEKAQSREIFSKVGELAKAGVDLLRSEKEKFDDGKYDEALDNLGNLFGRVKDQAEAIGDSEILREVARLEKKRLDLKEQVDNKAPNDYSNEEQADLNKEWRELMKESEDLMENLEDKGRQ